MSGKAWLRIGLIALVVIPVLAATAVSQSDEPGQSDETFQQIQRAIQEYNEQATSGDGGFLGQVLVTNARVNLYVRGEDGTQTVYSFRTDDQRRVTQLRRGPVDNPTFRVTTSRQTIDRVAASNDKASVVRQEVRSGRIRIERVVELLPGVTLAVGAEEALAGAGGVAIAAIAVAKVGVEGIIAMLIGAIQKVVGFIAGALRTLWSSLGSIATVLTILDQLELLDRVKRSITYIIDSFRTTVDEIIGGPQPGSEDDPEERR